MEALIASYGDSSSDSDSDQPNSSSSSSTTTQPPPAIILPPPPLSLLNPSNSFGTFDYLQSGQANRVRSFPHVDGNYALHVYIPVYIPSSTKKELIHFLKKFSSLVPDLNIVDIDIPLINLVKDDQKLEQVALGREFHISLGRTVPIRVHQIDSVVAMLRQKLPFQRRYWIDFNKWEIFVNDDQTRTFLSMEVKTGGLPEITKQIQVVNEVYKLHNLPEFYKDPRPHISMAWASGDTSELMKRVINQEMKINEELTNRRLFTCKFPGIECKIGSKNYRICKCQE
jgi:hypothetical protein